MRDSNIEKYIPLIRRCLDQNHYTLSLLREAEHLGLIDQQIIDDIQKQFMFLLGELIMKYTRGESTSVRVETAQRIMLSILYCIDSCTRSFLSPRDAINLMKTKTMKEIYKNGLELVKRCLADTEQLYREIEKAKMDYPVIAYQSTINEAIPDFFDKYDVDFAAQDTMASIDYPLLFDDTNTQGIYYIKQYLQKLEMETQFCSLFAWDEVENLLYNYGRVYGIDYREALINIFEIVLTNSIFSVVSGNNADQLRVTPARYGHLQEKFKDLDNSKRLSIIDRAVEVMILSLKIERPELRVYIRRFKSVLVPRFLCALEHNNLANVIIIDGQENPHFDIIFNEGNRMDDNSFCILVDQIIGCRDVQGKTELINSNIQSLGDFIDVMEADCLHGAEFAALFDTMGDMELSTLARIVFIEELRSDQDSFSLSSASEQYTAVKWQHEYASFIHKLDSDRLEAIEKCIKLSFQR